MKTLHAAENIRGGVGTVVRNLLRDQAAVYGDDAVLCLVPDAHTDELDPFWPGRLVTFRRSGRNLFSFLRFVAQFTKTCLRERPDLIHLHSAFAGFLGRAALMTMWPVYRPRIVYCPHTWAFLRDDPPLKKRIYAMIERCFSAFTHEIICVSHYEQTQAMRYGLAAERLHVIHSGVVIPESLSAPKPHGADDEVSLLFIGSFDYQKGFDILLDAMKKLENEPFHLIAVSSSEEEKVRPVARPNVYYAGWVSPAKVAAYYDSADVLVIPSRWEGFAIAPIEAMSRGRPVLASDCSSLPEVVTEDKTGKLFPKGDSEALADILRATTAEEWQRMGRDARIYCEHHFNAEKMCALTRGVYDTSFARLKAKD